MLKFIANFFGLKKAPESKVPYKIETPVETPVVNNVKTVVNGRKPPTKKTKNNVATGNAPVKKSSTKKKVSS